MGKEKSDWFSYRKTPRVSADFLIEREMIAGAERSFTTLLRLYYPTCKQRAKFLTNTTLDLSGQTPLSVRKQSGRELLVQRLTGMVCLTVPCAANHTSIDIMLEIIMAATHSTQI